MTNISGNGIEIIVKGSVTYPSGISVTQFADDADPLDFPELAIADTAMGINGDLVVWNTPNPIEVPINVIPNSDNDKDLSILFEANRVAKGKRSAKDVITMTVIYPDGKKVTLNNGALISGTPANGIASAGRMKSKPYTFRFEGKN